MQILDGIKTYQELGLNSANATSAFCQNLILNAISKQDILNRFEKILADRIFKQKLRTSNKNWVNEDIDKVTTDLLQFIKTL